MKGILKLIPEVCWVFVLVIIISCENPARKPEGILSHQEMVKVLAELYINEEKITRLSLPSDSAAQVFTLLKDRIFETTGIPDSVFRSSMSYYQDHPKEMEKIYGILVDSLQLREQRSTPLPTPE